MGQNGSETSICGPGGSFESTLWTMVDRAKDPKSPDRQEALQELIKTYWKPVYNFIRRKGKPVEAAKDLTQGYFTKMLSNELLKGVDQRRGRFRSYLIVTLEHFLADEYDRACAQKRGGDQKILSLDFEDGEREFSACGSGSEDHTKAFVRDWGIQVMAQALEELQQRHSSSGRIAEFRAFKAHLTTLRPEGASYQELAEELGISVEDVRNRIKSTRAAYRQAILSVIRRTCSSEAEAKEELKLLLSAFS